MRRIGPVYLILYLADAVLSLTALRLPFLEPASNALSMLQMPFAAMVFVMAASGRLLPRKPYFIATGYYFVMVAFGGVAAALVAVKAGPDAILKGEPSLATLTQPLPWAAPVIWTLTAVFVVVAVHALRLARREESADARGDRVPAAVAAVLVAAAAAWPRLFVPGADGGASGTALHSLTPEVLAGIPDSELEQVVFDSIQRKIGDEDAQEELRALRGLPAGLRALYATWAVDGEVNNGGFNQFFYNSSGVFADEAARGFEHLGLAQHAALVREAQAIAEANADKYRAARDEGTLEAFSKTYKEEWAKGFEPLVRRWYELDGLIAPTRIAHIRRHPEEYTAAK